MQNKASFVIFLILFVHSAYIFSQGTDHMQLGDKSKKEMKNMTEIDTMADMEEVAHPLNGGVILLKNKLNDYLILKTKIS